VIRRARRELVHLAGYARVDPRGNSITRRRDFQLCPRPVLLLHGFLSTRRTLGVLEQRLRKDNHCVFSIDLGGARTALNVRGIPELAAHVQRKVETLYSRYEGLGPLTVIGHSKGGLIARYYVARLGGHDRVRTLVTLGTPHNGTRLAYLGCLAFGWFARSLWQMTPVSPFILDLQRAPWPESVRFTSIYSPKDGVTSVRAARLGLEGRPQLRNIELPGCRHSEFLIRKSVYDVIRGELDAPQLPAPR
jgi:triacylglycerol lipase